METFMWLLPFVGITIVIGVLCGCVGTHIFTRRMSGMAGGLAHFLIAPLVVSYILQNMLPIVFPSIILTSICMVVFAFVLPTDSGKIFKVNQEVQILWGFGMSLGLFLLFLLPTRYNLEAVLFGSLLTMTRFNIIITCFVAVFVLGLQILFESRFKYLGVDDVFLQSRKINIRIFHILQTLITCVSIAVLLESIGMLMLVGIVSIPSAIAAMFAKSYRQFWLYSIAISVVVLVIGVYASYILHAQFTSFVVLLASISYFMIKFITSKRR